MELLFLWLNNILLQFVDEERKPLAPAEFTAGWYYGLSGHDKRDKILNCYEPDNKLTNLLYDGMEAYIAGDHKSGGEKIALTRHLFKKALSRCPQLDLHMFDKWAGKIDDMTSRSDWEEFANRVYLDNRRELERDTDLELREWK